MKRIYSIALLTLMITHTGLSQQTLVLTFTAIDSASYVQLDSIKVMNRTQEGDTVLYWNDTVLVLKLGVGLPEINSRNDGFQLRSYPNPLTDHATIEISVPEQGEIKLAVTDVLGRQLLEMRQDLQPGAHTFKFTPGSDQIYLLSVTWNGYHRTFKILNSSQNPDRQCTISYQGYDDVVLIKKAFTALQGFTYKLGDTLLFIGNFDIYETGLVDTPDSSQMYTFQFAYNIPCPGTPTVTYEGQVYNTVQIFSQCWLKENLNVGSMISGYQEMTDNGIIEKYCYNNEPDSCDKYGGLYQWWEMMQYTTQQGTQGICPPGWHIPTDEEWKVLEGAVDSQYGIGDTVWDVFGVMRGYDAGIHLKTTTGWNCLYGNYSTDKYGFSGLPAGIRDGLGHFIGNCTDGYWWTPVEYYDFYGGHRGLIHSYSGVFWGLWAADAGFSVRCIKD